MTGRQDDALIPLLMEIGQGNRSAPSKGLINYVRKHPEGINNKAALLSFPVQTLLHRAVFLDLKIVADWLLIKGADVNVVDGEGNTPLDYATSKRDQDLVNYLRSKGGLSGKNPYLYNNDGTVTDSRTGLTWMRCSLGQTWDGTTCIGRADTHDWGSARVLSLEFADHCDWRLPEIEELKSIVDQSRRDPAIDIGAFPNSPSHFFWSSSLKDGKYRTASYVNFDDGNDGVYTCTDRNCVRLVRGCMPTPGGELLSQDLNRSIEIARMAANMAKHVQFRSSIESIYNPVPEVNILDTPNTSNKASFKEPKEYDKPNDLTTRGLAQENNEDAFCNGNCYVDNSDGTVTDTHCGLMWMRCSIGQVWDGSTCIGKASGHTWDNANRLKYSFAEYDDWRLPSIDELNNIQSSDRVNLAANKLAFPCTPNAYFWSSTIESRTHLAWGKNFGDGTSITGAQGFTNHVRLVRNCNTSMPAEYVAPEELVNNTIDNTERPTLTETNLHVQSSVDIEKSIRFISNHDGTVTDAHSGLMWMRCSIDQRWDGTACVGVPGYFYYKQASTYSHIFAGHSDWRIPEVGDIRTIIESNELDWIINISASKNTPPPIYLLASPETPNDVCNIVNLQTGVIGQRSRNICGYLHMVRDCTKVKPSEETIEIFHSHEIGMTVDEVENATMKDGETAYIFYLSITNNQTKQVRVELPFSAYITAAKEEIEQDVWLAGHINGRKGATIRAGAHRKAGLVFHKTKLPLITIGDQLYVEVELPKTSLKYTFAFRCLDQAKRKYALVDVQSQSSNIKEILSNNIAANSGASHNVTEIIARFDSLENRFEESMNRIDSVLAAILTGQSTGLETITQIGHSTIATERLIVALSELRQELVPSLRPANNYFSTAPQRAPNSEQVTPALDGIAAFTAWLVGQHTIPLSVLRMRLHPLDLLPGAVINDINERALDLTGEPALEEDGDTVIVKREILLQVIDAWHAI